MLEHSICIGRRDEVKGTGPRPVRWFATCSCEWVGPDRLRQGEAVDDLRAHSAEFNAPAPAAVPS